MSTRDQPIIPKTSKQQPSSSNQNNSNINLNTSASNAGSTAASTSFSTTKSSSSITQSTSTTPATTTTTPGTLRTPAKSSFNEATSSSVFQFSTSSTNGQRPSLKQHQEPRTFGEPQQGGCRVPVERIVATYTEREAIKNSPGFLTNLKNFLSTTKKSFSSPKASSSKSVTTAAEQPGETAQSSPSSNPTTLLWDGNKFVVAEQGLDSGMLFIFKATKFDETENPLPAGSTIEFDSMQFLLRFQNGQHEVITAIAVDTPVNKVSIVTDKVYRGNLTNIVQLIHNKEMIYEHPSTDEITYFVHNCKIEPTEPSQPNRTHSPGIDYDMIEAMCRDIDRHVVAFNSPNFQLVVSSEVFYQRLNNLWPELDKRENFLRIIIVTVSHYPSEMNYIRKIFGSNLFNEIVTNIFQLNYNLQNISALTKISLYIVQLVCHGLERIPSEMKKHFSKIQSLIGTLNNVQEATFKESIKADLEKLKIAFELCRKSKCQTLPFEEKDITENFEFEDFREIPIVPRAYDLQNAPNIEAAIIQGKYESNGHYLQTQFHLMREDLIRPLRDGINAYTIGEGNLVVYNVELAAPTLHNQTGEIISYANIKVPGNVKLDKRLKYGNLVCLSSDGFQKDFLMATIVERKSVPLLKVGLKFEGDNEVSTIDIARKYQMVESPAFFEAYRHTMSTLQAMKKEIPFSRYLVTAEAKTSLPYYVVNEKLNFDCLIKSGRKNNHFYLHEIKKNLKPEDFGMDESQFNAIIYFLSSQLAIIQGPPGTGKTYMGLKIVQLLLDNAKLWNPDENENSPLLVICYTNHALDKFLQGISQFLPDGIVRVGGRCQNEVVEQFNLSKIRMADNSKLKNEFNDLKIKTNFTQKQLKKLYSNLNALETKIADPEIVKNIFYSEGRLKSETLSQLFNSKDYKWFTQFGKRYTIKPEDIQIVKNLMAQGISEITAKNSLEIQKKLSSSPPTVIDVYNFIKSEVAKNISNTQLIKNARYWPLIEDIDKVQKLGIPEELAAEMLKNRSSDERSNVQEKSIANEIIQEQKRIKKTTPLPQLTRERFEVPSWDFLDESSLYENEEDQFADDPIFGGDYEHEKDTEANDENMLLSKIIPQNYLQHIANANPMSETEANRVKDVWQIPLQQRWKLYQYWIKKCRETVMKKIEMVEQECATNMKALIEIRSSIDVHILKNAKVIGMTATSAAKYHEQFESLRPKIVVAEEAAAVLEANLLASVPQTCHHLILIGDHKQLRPKTANDELAKMYNLNVSLFERLITNGYPHHMLKFQHRMHPGISQFVMPFFYEGLRDDPSLMEFENVKGVPRNFHFISHSYPEEAVIGSTSFKNKLECELAIRLAKYFLQQAYKAKQITILCTYLDQLLDLQNMACTFFGKGHGLTIATTDNYQGEENDIIILSLVRSNTQNKIGYLAIPNNVCVALSRAKMGLFVIGNSGCLANNSDMWRQICQRAYNEYSLSGSLEVQCQNHNTLQVIESFEDFNSKCPLGGCQLPCDYRLKCGHKCTKPCHTEDIEHEKQYCLEKCERKCINGHVCEKRCVEPCGACLKKVRKLLPCGHQQTVCCFFEDLKCNEPCQKKLQCGHQCLEKCGAPCTTYCKKPVERKLSGCSHIATVYCGQNMENHICKATVYKEWPLCKHNAQTECSSDVLSLPCPYPCNTALAECGHLCKGSCGECRNGRLHISCSEICNKPLVCEHQCDAKCSNICPPCSKLCGTACGHSQCGNEDNQESITTLFESEEVPQIGRKCGEPCPPCIENCLNQCEHRKCSKKCFEQCDVAPCNEPCQKILPCGLSTTGSEPNRHRCIGLCGEICPNVCKTCDGEKFAEVQQIFFGDEENENARFIQLEDCKHIFEVNGLDKWITKELKEHKKSEDVTELVSIKCPTCNTAIRRSKRYISTLNERAADVEQIKQKIRGLTKDEMIHEYNSFKKDAITVFNNFRETGFGKKEEIQNLQMSIFEVPPNVLTKEWVATSRNILRIIQTLTKYAKAASEEIVGIQITTYHSAQTFDIHKIEGMENFKEAMKKFQIISFWHFLNNECNNLVRRIKPFGMSEYTLQQISNEIQRFALIVDLFSYFWKAIKLQNDFSPNEIRMIKTIFDGLNGNKDFDFNFEQEISQKLKDLEGAHPVSNFGVSEKERFEIVKAMKKQVTQWYKCPNGHYYGIGDCGGAVEESKCPECHARIGGSSHRILSTNRAAQNEVTAGISENSAPPNPFEARY